ncbi:MAG: hypothetical protein ACI8V4_001862 [Ilumatobacter sp.]|jgi:hypothetical protein
MRRWASVVEELGLVTPARQLLVGLVPRLDTPGSDDCHVLLRSAADEFTATGDDPAAVAALGALGFALHVRRDAAGLIESFGMLGEMAARGVKQAIPYPALVGAIVATLRSNPAAVMSQTDDLLG